MITAAFVKIWDQTVGAIAWNEDTGIVSFEYDPNFVRSSWDLSPIKMPISSMDRIFTFSEL